MEVNLGEFFGIILVQCSNNPLKNVVYGLFWPCFRRLPQWGMVCISCPVWGTIAGKGQPSMNSPEQVESATPESSAVQSIWGVLLAPESGRLLADLVVTGRCDRDLSAFSPIE